ncbi:MAG: DUF501 domain-containing protein [Coriobacteriia bacterium]|nr:DUF501 domain-containing protein [Coriobacteriia bacterium]
MKTCRFEFPQVIVSPSLLDDGDRFPNWAYLSCPHLVRKISRIEAEGGVSRWAARVSSEENLRSCLERLDTEVREVRLLECRSSGQDDDVCEDVGLAGQRNIYGVKCLHIHVAYALAGLHDPIGNEILEELRFEGNESCKGGEPCA